MNLIQLKKEYSRIHSKFKKKVPILSNLKSQKDKLLTQGANIKQISQIDLQIQNLQREILQYKPQLDKLQSDNHSNSRKKILSKDV